MLRGDTTHSTREGGKKKQVRRFEVGGVVLRDATHTMDDGKQSANKRERERERERERSGKKCQSKHPSH
jgi:hypothetical protein